MDFIKKNQEYKEIIEEDDCLSTTDVESQPDDATTEKQYSTAKICQSSRPKYRRSRTSLFVGRFRRFRWIIDFVLLIVNISLSVVLLASFNRERSSSSMQVGGDFTGAGPNLPTKIVKWAADESFVPNNTAEFLSDATKEKWNSMLPAGAGWGAPTDPDETFFTTSMTHQLHCVYMMGRIFTALNSDMSHKLASDYHTHYLHCVDYLRQAIMCSADLAMEPHGPDDPDDNGPMDGGWHAYHVCKDYSHVIPYLEEEIETGVRKVLPIDD